MHLKSGLLPFFGIITFIFLACNDTSPPPESPLEEEFAAAGKPAIMGEGLEFRLSVSNLDTTAAFFQQLGFTPTVAHPEAHPVQAFTDGSIVISLHQAEFPSPTITYYRSNLAALEKELKVGTVPYQSLRDSAGELQKIIFSDYNGQRFTCYAQAPVDRPDVRLVMMDPTGARMAEQTFSRCGMFGEYAIPTADRDSSAAYWASLGFRKMFASNVPYPWGIYFDNQLVMGLHQTTEFQSGMITFFSNRAAALIAELKADGYKFAAELDPANAVLETPDGTYLNIFNWQ